MIVDGGEISLSTATSGTQFKLKEGVQDSLKFISGGNGSSPLHSCRSTLAPKNDPSIFSGVSTDATTTSTLNVTEAAAANADVVMNTLAVEAKTTFNGLVDFSNSSIPMLRVDGNLTADVLW